MQSLLGVDLFGTHGDDMKQISDRKEHQTQNRIRGEYENREGPWRGDPGPRVHDSTHFFSTKTSPRHDGSSIADYFVDKPEQDQAKYWRNYDIERSLAPELAPRDEYEASLKIQRVARKWLARRRNAARDVARDLRDQLFRPRRRPPLRSAGLRKGVGGEAAPDGAGSRGERRAFCVCGPDVRGVPDCSRVQVGAGGADGAAGLGVVGRACRGSHRGRQRDGGARGEAPLVVTEGQQEAAADLS